MNQFLKSCKLYGDLFLGTAAGQRYARNVLKAMRIYSYFDRIYAAEDFAKGLPYFDNCILIDNDAEMGELKLSKIRAPFSSKPPIRQDLLTIDTFTGKANDTTLLDVISKLKNLK